MRSRILWFPVWALASAGAPTMAAAETLRWADVVARLDENPRLAEARSRARAAAAAARAVSQVPNPKLEVTGGEGQSQDGSQRRTEWALSLTVPLEWLATRSPRVDAARAGATAAEEEAESIRRDVLLQLRRLFVTVAYDQDLVASLESSLGQTEELARLIRRRVEKGEGRPTELPRVEIEVERARGALEQARARGQTHREQLSSWLGRPVGRVDAEPESDAELPPLAGVQALASERNPLVLGARARLASADAEVRAEKNQRIPALSVSGYALSELDRKAVGGRLGIDLPVWNWNTGKIEQAEWSRSAEESRLAVTQIEIAGAVSSAWHLCRQGVASTRRFREVIVPRAEQTARTLERSFQLGEASLLEVLDARRVLLDARRDALAAELEKQLECATVTYLHAGELR